MSYIILHASILVDEFKFLNSNPGCVQLLGDPHWRCRHDSGFALGRIRVGGDRDIGRYIGLFQYIW